MSGDPQAPTLRESSQQITNNFNRSLPKLLAAINTIIPSSEMAKLNAAELVVPGYTELANRTNNAATINNEALNLNILDTIGRQRAGVASEIDKQINPEFYAAKPEILQGILSQINALDLSKPNIEAERLVNAENVRAGTAGNNSGTTGVANALAFESEKLKRSQALTSALNTANSFLNNSRATFDPFGKSTVSDANVTNNIPNVQSTFQSIGKDAQGLGENFMSGLFGLRGAEMGINAQRRDSLDRVNETMSSMPSISCCFIFLEAYNGRLPHFVRQARDAYYSIYGESVAKGYRRMAKWLVPLMEKSPLVRELVNIFMVEPLTAHAGYLYGVDGYSHGKHNLKYHNFWFSVWRKLSY